MKERESLETVHTQVFLQNKEGGKLFNWLSFLRRKESELLSTLRDSG